MTKSKLLGLAAILSAAIATSALAAGETATRPWSAPELLVMIEIIRNNRAFRWPKGSKGATSN
jgi:hypothetical protein